MINVDTQIVIPMCGSGSRFFKKGFLDPKPLILLNNHPFFYWSATSALLCFKNFSSLYFVVLQEHVEKFDIINKIKAYFPFAHFLTLSSVLNGPVFTCLYAAEHLDLTKPVVFCDCDLAFSNKKANTIDADALLFCFHSKSESYSYVEVDKQGFATRTVEKQVISSNAICGCYCFNRTLDFIVAAKKLINNDETSEKYMSNVFNYLIDEKKKVKICVVDWQLSFGTPEEYAEVSKDASLLERLLQNGK
jgi:dTDP-glucose pyrophosphorylase